MSEGEQSETPDPTTLTLERDLARAQVAAYKTENDRLREQIRAFQARIQRFLTEGY